MSALSIRPMRRADLDRALDWAAAEGWNPGRDDAEPFFAADPSGFLMGFIGEEPVACISVVAYGDAYGFLGLFICRPEFRGRGHGRALWQAGIARMGDERVIGLDGVVEQQASYARSGFVLVHRNIRFGGIASAHEIADMRIVEVHPGRPTGLAGSIVAYDRCLQAGPRETFLRAWLKPPGRRTLAFVEANSICGYGSMRECLEGYKIGPLFADTPEIAERLFSALTGRLYGAPIFLDVPEPNGEAVALARRHGLEPVFETARMYRGPAPALPLARTFGITTFELG